ncbi:MAG: DUF1844 domain-containing protein [Verrucomicrobiaceae bacterium]|nr:MAG: DUF1844 domain-containing protein [Verrucomicrobiaceae bacterium]
MAEVQKTTEAGEMTQLFIQFLMMQQQQALLALGKHPNPPPGAPPSNIQLGKVFVDHLGMIREKTRGNLTPDEQQLLNTVLATLQMAYVEASKGL